jgi:hypothetical protein
MPQEEEVIRQASADCVVGVLSERHEHFTMLLQAQIEEDVRLSTTTELLTLNDSRSGVTHTRRPSLTPGYLSCLTAYLQRDGAIGSGIEDVVVESVRRSTEAFLQDGAVYAHIAAALDKLVTADIALRAEFIALVREHLKLVIDELKRAGDDEAAQRLLDIIAALKASVAPLLSQTAAGTALAGLIAKALAFPAVKAAILKGILYAMGSAAFKKALMVMAKKYGIVLIIQAVLLKIGVTASAGAISVMVLAPLLAWILHHEWREFPTRLAKRLSRDFAVKMGAKNSEWFRDLGRIISDSIWDTLMHRFEEASKIVAADSRLRVERQRDLFQDWLDRVGAEQMRRKS